MVSNHVSWLDPVVLGALITCRPIYFMAKRELFRGKLLNHFVRTLCAFPVDRTRADLGAIRRAVALLKAGRLVGMFPEGHRNFSGELGPFHDGVAVLASMTKAPVIPVAVVNSRAYCEEWTPLAIAPPPEIRLGPAVVWSGGGRAQFTAQVREQVCLLLARSTR
ncbi:MAG: 1-acyl-sn-glycerol-3-phosphate acyltransferase [Candidatus Eremiobacteraeota bacterium]|nr:1-acyl-sn-glycerol-3-phosphate acyltransferase [Candidatus Eremiobacteraeota bacterium]